MPKIVPANESGDYRQFHINSGLTPKQIADAVGFPANVKDDPDKVKHSWGFYVDGQRCGVWDYRGARWSAFGPREALEAVFGPQNVSTDRF